MTDEAKEDFDAQQWLAQAFNLLTFDDLWEQYLTADELTPPGARTLSQVGALLRDMWLSVGDSGMDQYVAHRADWVARSARQSGSSVVPHESSAVRTMAKLTFGSLREMCHSEAESLRGMRVELEGCKRRPDSDFHRIRSLLLVGATLTAHAVRNSELAKGFEATLIIARGLTEPLGDEAKTASREPCSG
ncbi:hypothetical protein ACFV3F_41770 [Streptomyces sp. NPDC059717]|uniref:hypothetical protein n=1 Tax=Streptomyces sp. NPDC059717 TaxID=3346922 RepID=UPI0036BE4207